LITQPVEMMLDRPMMMEVVDGFSSLLAEGRR
jgi:hypothetical protein